jgi:hypothetical protein
LTSRTRRQRVALFAGWTLGSNALKIWCDGSLQPKKDLATMAAKDYDNAKWKVQIAKRRRPGDA